MASQVPVLGIESLVRVEAFYRRHLADRPEDMTARTRLAWCLLLQALHRAGQEQILQELLDLDAASHEHLRRRLNAPSEQDAARKVEDCLRQAFTVIHLSADPRDVSDAENLQALIRLSGADSAVNQAAEEACRITGELARDILHLPDTQNPPRETPPAA